MASMQGKATLAYRQEEGVKMGREREARGSQMQILVSSLT